MHRRKHRFATVYIEMYILLLCNFSQTATDILHYCIRIQLLPFVWIFTLIQLRNLDRIFYQRDQTLCFVINSARKLLDVLFFDKSVLDDLCKSRNRSQRCFQLMRYICRKFSA